MPEQYVTYIRNLVAGDLGISFRTKRPVAQDIAERLPATLELVIAAMLFGTLSGIALGVLAARFRNGGIDHGARLFALFGSSHPRLLVRPHPAFHLLRKTRLAAGPRPARRPLAAPPFVTGCTRSTRCSPATSGPSPARSTTCCSRPSCSAGR